MITGMNWRAWDTLRVRRSHKEAQEAAATVAGRVQDVQVLRGVGLDQLERGRLAVAAAAALFQAVDRVVELVARGLALLGDQLRAAQLDRRLDRLFAHAVVLAG